MVVLKTKPVCSNAMKQTIFILLALLEFSAFGQNYPFAKNFAGGTVILNDFTRKTGQIKWFPHQNEKLKFRENERGETIKYSPEEIAGFMVDTFKFVSLLNFKVYADEYALLGKTSNLKHTFGQLLDTGRFTIYFVLIAGFNALSGSIQTYPNFLFQNARDSGAALIAYPFAIRMKDKKYENAKDDLYALFKDYPEVVEKLRVYKQQDDFFEIVDMVKAINRRQ